MSLLLLLALIEVHLNSLERLNSVLKKSPTTKVQCHLVIAVIHLLL